MAHLRLLKCTETSRDILSSALIDILNPGIEIESLVSELWKCVSLILEFSNYLKPRFRLLSAMVRIKQYFPVGKYFSEILYLDLTFLFLLNGFSKIDSHNISKKS